MFAVFLAQDAQPPLQFRLSHARRNRSRSDVPLGRSRVKIGVLPIRASVRRVARSAMWLAMVGRATLHRARCPASRGTPSAPDSCGVECRAPRASRDLERRRDLQTGHGQNDSGQIALGLSSAAWAAPAKIV